MNFRDQA